MATPSSTPEGGPRARQVVVPMVDLHFRALHVRGWWVSEWLSSLPREERQANLQARAAPIPPAWQPW